MSVIFSTFTTLYNHHGNLIPEHLHLPKNKPGQEPISSHSPFSPHLQLLATYILTLIANSGHWLEWSHALCVLLWLASVTQHNLFHGHPRCSMGHYFSLFIAEYCSIVQICYTLFIQLAADGHWSCFPFGVSMKNAAMTIHTIPPRVEFLGHVVTPCLTFWGTSFHFTFPSATCKIQFLYILMSSTCYCLFCFIYSSGCEPIAHCAFGLHFPSD